MTIDSDVLGMPVYAISEISAADQVDEILRKIDGDGPSYVVCKIPIELLDLIHDLQRRDFLLVETQLRTLLRLRCAPQGAHDLYDYEQIVCADDLD